MFLGCKFIKKEIKKFFMEWDSQEHKLNIKIVDHYMEKIMWKAIDDFEHEDKVKDQIKLSCFIEYCYKYKENFQPKAQSVDKIKKAHSDYVEHRKKAGFFIITDKLNVVLVKAPGIEKLNLPKGKEDYLDADLKETAVRELREETGYNFIVFFDAKLNFFFNDCIVVTNK